MARFSPAFAGNSLPTDLTLFDPQALPRNPKLTSDLAAFVDEQDVFYVGGGNTVNLLAMWRAAAEVLAPAAPEPLAQRLLDAEHA